MEQKTLVSLVSDVGCKRLCQVLKEPHPTGLVLRLHECPVRAKAELGCQSREWPKGQLEETSITTQQYLEFGRVEEGEFFEKTQRKSFQERSQH